MPLQKADVGAGPRSSFPAKCGSTAHSDITSQKNPRAAQTKGKLTSITENLHCPFYSRLFTGCSLIELGAKQRHCCLCTAVLAQRCTSFFSLGKLNNPKGSLYLQLGKRESLLSPMTAQHSQDRSGEKWVGCAHGLQRSTERPTRGLRNKQVLFIAFTKVSQHLPKYPKCQTKGFQQGWPGAGAAGGWGSAAGSIPGLCRGHLLCS